MLIIISPKSTHKCIYLVILIRFKSRYHPDENYKRRNEQHQNIINRVDVFMDLMNKGWLNDISADYDKANEIVRFLDAGKNGYFCHSHSNGVILIFVSLKSVVIKLEGGSDQDVKQLLDGTADVEIIDAKKEVIELDGDKAHRKTNGADAKVCHFPHYFMVQVGIS